MNKVEISVFNALTVFDTLDFALRKLSYGETMSLGQFDLIQELLSQCSEQTIGFLKQSYPKLFLAYENF